MGLEPKGTASQYFQASPCFARMEAEVAIVVVVLWGRGSRGRALLPECRCNMLRSSNTCQCLEEEVFLVQPLSRDVRHRSVGHARCMMILCCHPEFTGMYVGSRGDCCGGGVGKLRLDWWMERGRSSSHCVKRHQTCTRAPCDRPKCIFSHRLLMAEALGAPCVVPSWPGGPLVLSCSRCGTT
jgi:hypothetical protein